MPHKVTTIKRYRISNDVLILILENLNPVSLYRTCQAFERIYVLVMQFQHLRYRFELAVVGMRDGPASHSAVPFIMRLQLLSAYKTDWPRLKWIDENKIKVPTIASKIGVSGSFLYYVGNQALDILELPSYRIRKPLSQPLQNHYNTTPAANCVAIDPIQALIITSHTQAGINGQTRLCLKIRHLWTFDKHPAAPSAYYDCSIHAAQQIHEVSMSICATRMICTLRFVSGLSKHLLMDWTTLQAIWLEEQDIFLLNPYFLLGVRKIHNRVALYLYNISDMGKVFIEREYELPAIWTNSIMRFGCNISPNADISIPPTAIFCSDPSARIVLLSARSEGPDEALSHWMFISESFFRPTSLEDRRTIPWGYWSQFCLIKEFQPSSLVGLPQVVGSRVVYLEKDGSRSAAGHCRTRLKIIDFAPYSDLPSPSPKAWSLLGKYSILRPGEYQRDFSATTTNGLVVENIFATEDNIVLLLEKHGNIRPVNILTFGPTPSKALRQEIQYHPAA